MLLLLACAAPDPGFGIPDRAPGDRTPLTATCDDLDPTRCLLPWPSSTFTTADPTTATGVRVAVDPGGLPIDDDPTWINLADGFSTVSPIATGFAEAIDPATLGALRLFLADGSEVPLTTESVHEEGSEESLLIGYADMVLPVNTDLVAIVTDSLRTAEGAQVPRDRPNSVALGVTQPENEAEATLAAYHAPSRTTLAAAGVDTAGVLRVWDFNTRSAGDVATRLEVMRAAALAAPVTIDVSAVREGSGPIALIVEGTVEGVPYYVEDGWLAMDEGVPVSMGLHGAKFRVVIPVGEGDYKVILYGHGTGGDVHDSSFDADITGWGRAKVGIEFAGWTGGDLIDSIVGMKAMMDGTSRSTSGLLQALADGAAVLQALDGPLGDVLTAETIDGVANPTAGRRPDLDKTVWIGGSLGGTLGAVMCASSPEIEYGVLNVPTGAWTRIIPVASMYTLIVEAILEAWYPTTIDARLAILQTQNAWDDVDGAAWEDADIVLLQESIGDPVAPNAGTVMLARARNATLIGAPIDDHVSDFAATDVVEGASGLTQYRTDSTSEYDIHGFGATNSAAGIAAREQIAAFLTSIDAGSPRIEVPASCTDGSCDWGEGR